MNRKFILGQLHASLLVAVVAVSLPSCQSASSHAASPVTPAMPVAVPVAAPSSLALPSQVAPSRVTDTLATSNGDLRITPVRHGAVLFQFAGKAIYVDPVHDGDYSDLPKADYVLITHDHFDHFDREALGKIKTPSTQLLGPAAVDKQLPVNVVLRNGESKQFGPVQVEAVPMYNLKRGPSSGHLYHEKGVGNGYVLSFADKRVYLSGDTECTDEMRALKNIDIAFVCMNLPYTMTPAEAASCVKSFRPKVLIPYHYRGQNLDEVTSELAGEQGIEVRKRAFY